MKNENLRLGGRHKATSDRNRFGGGGVVTQIILAGFGYLPSDDEEGLLKVLQVHVNDGIVKSTRVSFLYRLGDLRYRHLLHKDASDIKQSDISVRLDCDRLIQLRRQRERDIEDVISHHLVARIALLQCRPVITGTSVASSGRCDGLGQSRDRVVLLGPQG